MRHFLFEIRLIRHFWYSAVNVKKMSPAEVRFIFSEVKKYGDHLRWGNTSNL